MLLGRAPRPSKVRSWALFTLLFSLALPSVSSAVADLPAVKAAEGYEVCCRAKDRGVYETGEFVFFLVKLTGIDASSPEQDLRLEATLRFFTALEEYIFESREKSLTYSFSGLKMHILHQERENTRYLYHVAVAHHEIARLRAIRTGG